MLGQFFFQHARDARSENPHCFSFKINRLLSLFIAIYGRLYGSWTLH